MKLELKRTFLGDKYTIGSLFINGKLFCNTLEDTVRDLNKDGDLNEYRIKKKMRYNLVLNDRGFYEFKFSERKNKKQANYHSYIKRCCHEFQTESFQKQIRKSKHIAYSAINKYLNE